MKSASLFILLFSLIPNIRSQVPSPPIAPIPRIPPRAPPIHRPQLPPQTGPVPGQFPPGFVPGPGTVIRPPFPAPRIPGAPTRPPIMGHFGQDCTPAPGDFPEACPTVGQTLFSTNGKIECIHNFDCCTCGIMHCAPDCNDLVCNGDSSCYGVRDIKIDGRISGAAINCNGDLSCMKTGIVGTNIASILCSGDGSCSYSLFNLECLPTGCTLECVGDSSCDADPVIPALNAIYTIANSKGMSCSAAACKYATFNLLTNIGGAIICGAYDACRGAKITANNVDAVSCGGRDACRNAEILIINPQNEFQISCQSANACWGMRLEILVTDPLITRLLSISCGAMNSCENAEITISKILPTGTRTPPGTNDLIIEDLACGGYRSCYNTKFYLTPNVAFEQCGCAGGGTQACEGLLGVESCASGVASINCVGMACKGMTETIVNPLDGFELFCPDPGSCEGYTLTIRITDAPNAPRVLNGVTCGSWHSCKGFTINIVNLRADGNVNKIAAGTVTCGSINSCQNAIIVTHNADITAITCGDATSCVGCQQWTNMQYNACDSPPRVV